MDGEQAKQDQPGAVVNENNQTDIQSSPSAECEPSTSQSTTTNINKQENKDVETSRTDEDDEDDEDGEAIITLADYLKEEEDIDAEATAVLGAAEPNDCSFQKGYVPRQALYACTTCSMKEDPKTGEKYLAGFCLACSNHCHDGHEMVELFTKRNFRCDCGNEKFANTICKLFEKTGFNDQNKYNHNFKGVYCTCERPYPDPEDPVKDVMIQCGMCEDWYHSRHSFNKIEIDSNFCEMVCFLCVKKYNFLVYYHEDGSLENVDVAADASANEIAVENETESLDSGIVSTIGEPSSSTSGQSESQIEPIVSCKLEKSKQNYVDKYKTETIDESKCVSLKFDENWRMAICKCVNCTKMYHDLDIDFIASRSDMVATYERTNMKLKEKSEEDSMSALDKLPHVQKVELIHGFMDFKNELEEYLKPFSVNKRVVRQEDIQEFIEKMKSRKRQRVEIPYNCK